METIDASTCTIPIGFFENMKGKDGEINMGMPMDMMNGVGMIPSSMMMPFCYSMASMMVANMEMSRLLSMVSCFLFKFSRNGRWGP